MFIQTTKLKLNNFLAIRGTFQGNNTESSKNGLLGSLGRSVGNKLRFKLSRSNSIRGSANYHGIGSANTSNNRTAQHVLCALLYTDQKPEYLDVMIKNYLQTAMERFEQTNVSILFLCSFLFFNYITTCVDDFV